MRSEDRISLKSGMRSGLNLSGEKNRVLRKNNEASAIFGRKGEVYEEENHGDYYFRSGADLRRNRYCRRLQKL